MNCDNLKRSLVNDSSEKTIPLSYFVTDDPHIYEVLSAGYRRSIPNRANGANCPPKNLFWSHHDVSKRVYLHQIFRLPYEVFRLIAAERNPVLIKRKTGVRY